MNESPLTPPTPQTPPPAPAQPAAPVSNTPKDHTDVFGIISIVMIFLFLHLPGFILGLIGVSKAKREGYSPILSRVGWIINLISMVLSLIVAALFVLLVVFAQQHADEIKSTSTSLKNSTIANDSDARTDSGDGFSITVPNYFTELEAEYRNDAASYSQGFDFTNEYIMVIKENATDFSDSMTITDYAELVNKQYADGSSLTNTSVVPLSGVANPNGLQVKDYEVTGDTNGIKVVYYVRYVKTATTYYQVIGWTSPSTVITAKPTLITILESFQSEQ